MEETGIVLKADIFGRVEIPKKLMKEFDIEVGTELELSINELHIAIKKPSYGFKSKFMSALNKIKKSL